VEWVGNMNNEETPYRIVLERRIMELRILLAHSISDSESLELAARLEEAKAMRMPGFDS
jgi:hypothetical protein